MNFNIVLKSGSTRSTRIVNCNSWSDCLLYAEGTQMDIQQISIMESTIVIVDSSNELLFLIILSDDITLTPTNVQLFDNDINSAISWANNQTGKTLSSINSQKVKYISL